MSISFYLNEVLCAMCRQDPEKLSREKLRTTWFGSKKKKKKQPTDNLQDQQMFLTV